MNDKAEKVYSEAFFELCLEECSDKLPDVLEELDALNGIFGADPDIVKLMSLPTVPVGEKVALMKDIISEGKVSELCGNLLCVLAERGRFNCFGGIVKCFRGLYNEHFKIAEITVTTSQPLTADMAEKIKAKMSEVTGMTVSIREVIDPAIIGGIIIDHGSTRYDGSVKSRLNALKNELGSVMA